MFIEASAKAGFNIKVHIPLLLSHISYKYQHEIIKTKAKLPIALSWVRYFKWFIFVIVD